MNSIFSKVLKKLKNLSNELKFKIKVHLFYFHGNINRKGNFLEILFSVFRIVIFYIHNTLIDFIPFLVLIYLEY